MRALVTGAQGFVGPFLVDSLTREGHTVVPFDLTSGRDVREYEAVRAAVEGMDAVFHLAGVSWPGESLQDPRRTVDVNVTGALHVLEAVRATGGAAKVLLVGSSEEYGYEHTDLITEDTRCEPTTPYGVSKLAATTLGMVYVRRWGLRVVAVRPFNHTGWGRPAVNAESAFAQRIVMVERGLAESVAHGPLTSSRNYLHVKDVVAAYRLLMRSAEPGVYNVASDETVTMAEVLDRLLAKAKVEDVPLQMLSGLGRTDAGSFPQVRAHKLRALGWRPTHSLDEALAEVLDYWRGVL